MYINENDSWIHYYIISILLAIIYYFYNITGFRPGRQTSVTLQGGGGSDQCDTSIKTAFFHSKSSQNSVNSFHSFIGSLPLCRIPLRRIPSCRIPLRRFPFRRFPLRWNPLCRISWWVAPPDCSASTVWQFYFGHTYNCYHQLLSWWRVSWWPIKTCMHHQQWWRSC